ncbi:MULTISPECIES: NAD(P)/FAD-dependent oxidoreductase [Ralstonia solanacearum species complex]|uniref:Oxidoreductase protein n=10 Tax=Ralstonia solanacearum TaxID=305 RepID=A0A7U7JEJ7_RALSL|nr:FAD/NAD(P)-binding oxidoreductase [Ralstonia solanacearum]ALF90523.1 Hydrogen cyanide synthase subunit HcnB [Ralstonia solanacearum]ATI29970.1 NAD(P)/FAD-dependent oxidoreductase [Ralstonia solanacearum]EAP70817.1 D-nopaline dehydrogenase [Ralstonia solanacearum UW551]KEI30551.1 (2Fe-2S)-binding protein [Ralstonia solanacearum]KFX80332.1 (2Fe-2S)-binding protein [Ralstonia solanacearum]
MSASATLPRIVVVGAGPAGVRAAQALVQAGLHPVVIDEGRRDGGQIYRRQPEGFKRPYAKLYGTEADKAQALHRDFDALRAQIDYHPDTLAWNLTEGALHVVRNGEPQTLPFDALLVCAGATDRLMPVPGWHRAGCYSLGAAQIALKAQACAIGSQVVFLGSGPLLYLVATQYVQAGARVAAVLDTAPAAKSWGTIAGLLARPRLALRGLGLIRALKAAGVPVLRGVTPLAIDGDDRLGAQAVCVRDASGRERRFACDAVGLGWHLRAETQLADLARCEFAFDPVSRQWLPRIDADGRSSTRGVYLAGDGARILGADGAQAAGRLAALAAMADLGHEAGRAQYAAESAALRRTLARMDRFRQGLAQAFPWPHAQAAALPDTAVVCRCEAVTVGELRRCVTELDSQEVNRAKAFSRVGMGRCQGRFCGHAAAEIVAQACGIPVEQVGRLRSQAPVKPLMMNTREVQA